MNSRIKEDVQRLFEYWCEITPIKKGDRLSGQIVESFPETFKDQQILNDIPEFAFPCEFENKNIQTYSFVLTSTDSKWRFGFCRHEPKTSTAMILITYLPWHDIFIKFLNVLADLKKTPNNEFQNFLLDAYNKGVPTPGASIKLSYDKGANIFSFQRPSQFQLPSIPENNNLNLYYNFVEPKFMIAIFAAMLAERRIIFTSSRLDVLSSCIQAANSFLYPMVWQHIFIPILPMKMKDFLSAPMPFLIGVPDAVLETIRRDEIGDVVILNCDKRILETPFDDVRNMPQELIAQLKKQLSNSQEHGGDRVSKIFLGILVQLIGGYRDAVKFNQGHRITWDRDTFIESRPPHLRLFLKNMLELQIFQQFIEERLEMLNTGLGFSDEFELETLRYAEKSGKRVKYKDFLKNVKDKTNPAVKSAVKSVREGGKGVKTAYKDLKSKFRDVTPPSRGHEHLSSVGHNNHHRSAPNSPVFTKRPQSEVSSYRRPQMLTNSPSTTLMTNINFKNYNNNNTITNKSPPISPPSSNSSSEMNILQELQQQHALFKSPAVDRSLKPKNSNEYMPIRPTRNGSIIKMPMNQQQTVRTNHQQQQPQLQPQHKTHANTNNHIHLDVTEAKIDDIPIGQLCLFDTITEDKDASISLNTSSSRSTNSLFDSPPEMPSPPVPPRVNYSNKTIPIIDAVPPPPPPVTASKIKKLEFLQHKQQKLDALARMSFENNFVPNGGDDVDNNKIIKTNTISLPSIKATTGGNPPIVAPRTTCKEIDADPTPDLITLDNNSSFELEDFDPLNKNAKPLPLSTSSSTAIVGAAVVGFNNPLYPYFVPTHQQSMQHLHQDTVEKNEEELELLKKYGLDQFSLLEPFTNGLQQSSSLNQSRTSKSSMDSSISSLKADRSSTERKNWTTFD